MLRRASDLLIFCIHLCVHIRTCETVNCDTYIDVYKTTLHSLDSQGLQFLVGRFSTISWAKSELYLSTPVYFINFYFILLGDLKRRLKLSHFVYRFYNVGTYISTSSSFWWRTVESKWKKHNKGDFHQRAWCKFKV